MNYVICVMQDELNEQRSVSKGSFILSQLDVPNTVSKV